MPIYDFECEDCHQVFELLVSTTRPPECPRCGSRKLTKQLSSFATSSSSGSGGHVHSSGCGHGHCHHH